MFLDAGDLSSMRDAVDDGLLPDKATIHRSTEGTDDAGGQTDAFAPVATDRPCRLAPSGGRESVVAAKTQAMETWTVTFPHDEDVRTRDRIEVAGHLLEVQAVLGAHKWTVALRVVCTEMTAT